IYLKKNRGATGTFARRCAEWRTEERPVDDRAGSSRYSIDAGRRRERASAPVLNLSPSALIQAVIIIVISLTVHEFAHSLAAIRLGDDTPRREGRLTLNPLRHVDLIGFIMLI